jgi:hypothetical protein
MLILIWLCFGAFSCLPRGHDRDHRAIRSIQSASPVVQQVANMIMISRMTLKRPRIIRSAHHSLREVYRIFFDVVRRGSKNTCETSHE